MTNTFIVDSVGGISGSLTHLVDGSSYLIAGSGVTITSQSNGSVRIDASSSDVGSGLYGTGYDGDATLDGTGTFNWATKLSNDYTMTRDVYLASLNITNGSTLKTNGYKVFVNGECSIASGTIDNSGINRFGAPAGSLPGGQNGTFSNQGDPGDLGGAGGASAVHAGGASTGLGPRSLPFSMQMFSIDPSGPSVITYKPGASGGGGGGAGDYAGGGGGFIVLVAKSINVSSDGSITANGGPGVFNSSHSGGGGGGGCIVTVSQTALVNSGSITVDGGSPGGSSGSIMQFIAS